jgi:hypothetical protein
MVRTHIVDETDKTDKWANARMTLEEFSAMSAPRVLKTHAPRHLFLGTEPDRVPSLTATGRPAPTAAGTKVV